MPQSSLYGLSRSVFLKFQILEAYDFKGRVLDCSRRVSGSQYDPAWELFSCKPNSQVRIGQIDFCGGCIQVS